MVDIDHQVTYWRDGACEEWQVAEELLERGRIRHALFDVTDASKVFQWLMNE